MSDKMVLKNDVKEPTLRDELLSMCEVDMQVQGKIRDTQEKGNQAGLNACFQSLLDIHTRHAARLQAITEEHGFPSISMVGKDGAHAAWLVVQHADHDLEFQKRVLSLVTAPAFADEAARADVAYLSDRVSLGERKPQRFGTQYASRDNVWTLENKDMVNEWRAQFDLPPLTLEDITNAWPEGAPYVPPSKTA
jgi:hypothetical protein